jgi:two-component system, NtrC family, sensor kinase
LHRATTMMLEQNGNLAEFLTTHPKGKLIPEFIGSVAEELVAEQTELTAEISSVAQHIEHIKEIVAMQQSYAKVSGVFENLSAADLVEDALRMNVAAFERHQINLIREFDKNTPPVCVDRHKVLQILINLIRNAKHAMENIEGQERCMAIRIGAMSPDQVEISVRDNGVGIPADHMTKIFNHGFTTKKDGHGFGLHSGANAAREMGGNLKAQSEGPGLGAEFTLELPTAATARKTKSMELQGTI